MTSLRPTMGLWTVVLYGIGTMVGAGIYVLVGKVAGVSGFFTPRAFMVAAVLALFSALSYAEMSSRFPQSAGAALYVYKGFGKVRLSRAIGILILLSGIVSAGVLSHGFGAYLEVFIPGLPSEVTAILILICLGLFSCLGMKESSTFVTVTTLISLFGLGFILRIARESFGIAIEQSSVLVEGLFTGSGVMSIIAGSFLAFYAFIGFEDLANVAEELKDPVRDMPKALVIIMILATILYGAVALVAQFGMPLADLQGSEKPLALLYESITGQSPIIITLISLFSVVNSIMVQILMGSRLLYGMGNQGWLPSWISTVSQKRQIPLNATLITLGLMIVFALILPMITLAQLTSFLILTIFFLVNTALVRIKLGYVASDSTASHFTVPIIIPILGAVFTIGLLAVVVSSTL